MAKRKCLIYKSISCSLVAGLVWILLFNIYTENNLGSQKEYAILSAKMWGTPEWLENEQNINATYDREHETGWDGQFHYYIANDWLNEKETSNNIDNPPYRYGRPGIAPFIWLMQKTNILNSIGPLEYIYILGTIYAIAVGTGYYILERQAINGVLIAGWAIWPSLFFTTFNGLPDALADSMFIISLALGWQRGFAKSVMLTAACLSREIYLIYPIIALSVELAKLIPHKTFSKVNKKTLTSSVVAIIFIVAWKLSLKIRLGTADTADIYGTPLSLLENWQKAIVNNWESQIYGLTAHTILIIAGICIGSIVLLKHAMKTKFNILKFLDSSEKVTLSVSLLTISLGYLWLGDTVLFNYTGYIKADQVIIIFIIFTSKFFAFAENK